MEVCEEYLVAAYEMVFGLDGLFYLYDHLGDAVDILYCGEDFCAYGFIFGIAESGAFAGCGLHVNLVSVSDEFLGAGRSETYAVLVVFNLFGYSDNHTGVRF